MFSAATKENSDSDGLKHREMYYITIPAPKSLVVSLCTAFILGMIRKFLLWFWASHPNRKIIKEDKRSSTGVSLSLELGDVSQNPVEAAALCLSAHFETGTWPGDGKGCDWLQDLGVSLWNWK